MKTKLTLAAIAALVITATAGAQSTILERTDMSHGNRPYQALGLLDRSGWEFWAFGVNDPTLYDFEVGRLYPIGKHLLVGGYATYWPNSQKWFFLPWVNYSDKIGRADLTLNLAYYAPLNNGPRITFCDESTLILHEKGFDYGAVLSHWHQEGLPSSTRLGATIRFKVGEVGVKLNCQPVYLTGSGNPTFRVETSIHF